MKNNDDEKKRPPRRANHSGSLRIRGGIFWARWKYHGQTYDRSTGIRVDMVDTKGNPCGRKRALAALAEMTEPYKHREEADVLTLISRRIELASKDEERAAAPRCPTLVELAEAYRKTAQRNDISKSHWSHIESTLSMLADWAGKSTRASAITEAKAKEWADHIWATGVAPRTYNGHINILLNVWKSLSHVIGENRGNPWEGIVRKKNDANTRRPITDEEFEAALAAAGDRYGGDVRVLLLLGRFTGLRISDCASMLWSAVDFQTGFIRLTQIKTGNPVTIPILPELAAALREHKARTAKECADARKAGWAKYWAEREAKNAKERDANTIDENYTAYVVPRMAERYVRERTLVNILIRNTFKKAGIETSTAEKGRGVRRRPVAGFHSLRHGLASRLAEAGVSERAAMEILGHRSRLVHENYVHIQEGFLREEMEKLEKRQEAT